MILTEYRNFFILCGVLGATLLSCSSDPGLAAGSSSTGNARTTGRVITPASTPAVNALVRLRTTSYTNSMPNVPSDRYRDTRTDTFGQFAIDSLDTGNFCIEVNDENQTAVLFNIHIDRNAETVDAGTGTLQPYALVHGGVDTTALSGSQLFVQIIGLERRVLVDASGQFIFTDLPAGVFDVRVISNNGQSVVGSSTFSAMAGDTITLPMQGFRFSKRLYINTTATGANVSQNVYNFPLLVRIDGSTSPAIGMLHFDFSQARDSGQDIRFTKADGSALPYEIEQWDAGTNQAAIWVNVDTVYGNNNQQFIVMYWGASAGVAPISGSNGAAVFDTANGFAGVWQMSDPGAIAVIADQTIRNSYGIAAGTWMQDSRQTGVIGKALRFNGIDNIIMFANNCARMGTQSMTLSAWIKTGSGAQQPIFSYQNDMYRLRIAMAGRTWFGLLDGDTSWLESPTQSPYFSPIISDDKWHLLSVSYERSTYARLTVDGIQYDSLDISSAAAINMTADTLFVGKDNFILNAFYTGMIDEVRLETEVRNPAWVKLNYENQRIDQKLVFTR